MSSDRAAKRAMFGQCGSARPTSPGTLPIERATITKMHATERPKRTAKLFAARRGVYEIHDRLYLNCGRTAALRDPVDLDMIP